MRLAPVNVGSAMAPSQETVALPPPRYDGDYALERALRERRSLRCFGKGALSLKQISQLLWAGQGVTSREGLRAAPSVGALYPLEVYLAVGQAQGLDKGVYRYLPDGHRLIRIAAADVRDELAAAAYGQRWVSHNALLLVFSAIERRTTSKYGGRGIRYIHIEVGHAVQNVLLQAVALGLGGVPVGAFDDERVQEIIGMAQGERALYLVAIGRR
jgi:SagB-type dehydrogenase family enzyme